MDSINKLSEELLLAVKKQESTLELETKLETFPLKEMLSQLSSDTAKKAFWINLYNSFFQILRKTKKLDKPGIYTGKHICIASKKISLDDIEHGILRRFRYKYSFGYFADPFVSKFIRKCAVDNLDYRIHFALNCGAKSCPPIAFYSTERLEQQLELATLSFIEEDTVVDEEAKEVSASSLFKWYSKDFGGPKGVKKILSLRLKTDLSNYNLSYNDYSWEEYLDNYDEANFT